MTKTRVLLVALLLGLLVGLPTTSSGQGDPSINAFWEKFRTAVIQKDKTTVANLSGFPIEMPYMVREVKTRAQFLRRYNEIFNGEADAAKCFRTAKPATEKERPKQFYVTCSMKDGGPETPIVYWFTRTRSGWKFVGLDNVNE